MRSTLGMVHAVLMIHPGMQQLCRETVGANLQGKWVVRRRHEARGYEGTKRKRHEQDAGDELAAALTCGTGAHVLQEVFVCPASLC